MEASELKKLVDELRAHPEKEWVEFKQNYCSDDELGEYISALSNAACYNSKPCGYLVFGIDDTSHEIKGTKFRPHQHRVGNQPLQLWLTQQLSPKVDFLIHDFDYDGLGIVVFVIDAASNGAVRFHNIGYIRIGTCKTKLNDHRDRERKIWSKDRPIFEKEIALRSADEDKVLSLLDYPRYFELLGLNLPTNKDGILQKLCEEKLIFANSGNYHITNLCAILFAKNLAAFERLSRKAVRVVIYKGKDKLQALKEQVGTKGYAIGFEGLIDSINSQLPINEEIGRVFRKEVKMYPGNAIRELVANALIHQDFSLTGTGPMIEIYSDRMEISNPGRPLISTLRFIDHNPQSRNELLAHFMRRINICEERGSGIKKVISAAEMYQLPAPEFIEEDAFLKVILFASRPLRQMDKRDKVRACYQHCCLRYVSNDYMTNKSLRERFRIDEQNYSVVSRIISNTIEEKLIKEYDPTNKSRKHAKYAPVWS